MEVRDHVCSTWYGVRDSKGVCVCLWGGVWAVFVCWSNQQISIRGVVRGDDMLFKLQYLLLVLICLGANFVTAADVYMCQVYHVCQFYCVFQCQHG